MPVAVVVAAAAVGAVAWAALSSRDDDGDVAVSEPGVVHVHGLGINPADGELYVATHSGLFRLPQSGTAVRIGDSYQDTMGFTVVGPDRFLGSGHPDLSDKRLRVEGKPPLLGLIESTDAGETWTPRSLLGDADFHGLAYGHDRVYGWNASTGAFMVSEDMRSWTTRSTVDLFGFAVDPDDPRHIVGAGPDGVVLSTDGGATWKRSAELNLVVVAWNTDGEMWGVEANGAVHHSGDGTTWRPAGELPGEPQALAVAGHDLYVAAHDADGRTAIYRSNDRGRTWQLRYRDPDQ